MLRDIATYFADLEGLVSESIRVMLVRRFCQMMATKVQNTDSAAYRQWLSRDQRRFVQECAITDTFPRVPVASVSQVERWANKWLHAETFKVRGNPDMPSRAITPEQNALRVTMLHDLKNMVLEDV